MRKNRQSARPNPGTFGVSIPGDHRVGHPQLRRRMAEPSISTHLGAWVPRSRTCARDCWLPPPPWKLLANTEPCMPELDGERPGRSPRPGQSGKTAMASLSIFRFGSRSVVRKAATRAWVLAAKPPEENLPRTWATVRASFKSVTKLLTLTRFFWEPRHPFKVGCHPTSTVLTPINTVIYGFSLPRPANIMTNRTFKCPKNKRPDLSADSL